MVSRGNLVVVIESFKLTTGFVPKLCTVNKMAAEGFTAYFAMPTLESGLQIKCAGNI